jgi:hypothetical protein
MHISGQLHTRTLLIQQVPVMAASTASLDTVVMREVVLSSGNQIRTAALAHMEWAMKHMLTFWTVTHCDGQECHLSINIHIMALQS